MKNNPFPSYYEEFIHKSRYARWIEKENRREDWDETVKRYLDFMFTHIKEKYGESVFINDKWRNKLETAIFSLDVMPSMRSVMTAGKALSRDNVAGYNCSYLPIDDVKCFDEAMYILLCGTGVGFSVERQYVAKLPDVPDRMFESETTIVVSDSKEGWAKAFRQLIALLYSGEIPRWDVSKIRPSGAKLKTFGGRASGPGPLEDLFHFTVVKMKGAMGRKLNSIECHDILCKVGEVVVVGGVRRSAMISLSNLSDDRMRKAKMGQWWETEGQRALSNNSIAFAEKPDVDAFMAEWLAIYQSNSGERGIFNRVAAQKQAMKYGRRDHNHEFGCNPCCVSGETVVNLKVNNKDETMKIKDLVVLWEAGNKIEIRAYDLEKQHESYDQISFAGMTRSKTKVMKITDDVTGKSITVTPDHKVYTKNRGYVEAQHLKSDDQLMM